MIATPRSCQRINSRSSPAVISSAMSRLTAHPRSRLEEDHRPRQYRASHRDAALDGMAGDLEFVDEKIKSSKHISADVDRLEQENARARREMGELQQKSHNLRREFSSFKEDLYSKNERIATLNDQIEGLDDKSQLLERANAELEAKHTQDKRHNESLASRYRSQIESMTKELSKLKENESKGKRLVGQLEADLLSTQEALRKVREENALLEKTQSGCLLERDAKRREVQELESSVRGHTEKRDEWAGQLGKNLDLFKRLSGDYERVLTKMRELEAECSRLTVENQELKARSSLRDE